MAVDHVRRQAAAAEALLGVSGISMVGVWRGETVDSVWIGQDRLRARMTIWTVSRSELELRGFQVVQTGSDPRHFTVRLPDLRDVTIGLLASLMRRSSR